MAIIVTIIRKYKIPDSAPGQSTYVYGQSAVNPGSNTFSKIHNDTLEKQGGQEATELLLAEYYHLTADQLANIREVATADEIIVAAQVDKALAPWALKLIEVEAYNGKRSEYEQEQDDYIFPTGVMDDQSVLSSARKIEP